MAIERINPSEIHQPGGYTHVVRTSDARTAYISGQVAIDLEGNVVGPGDMEAQAKQAFANLQGALASVDADFSHVAKLNIYIVNYGPEARPALQAARQGLPGGDSGSPASTLIGVQALALPELIIEIEAVVDLD